MRIFPGKLIFDKISSILMSLKNGCVPSFHAHMPHGLGHTDLQIVAMRPLVVGYLLNAVHICTLMTCICRHLPCSSPLGQNRIRGPRILVHCGCTTSFHSRTIRRHVLCPLGLAPSLTRSLSIAFVYIVYTGRGSSAEGGRR